MENVIDARGYSCPQPVIMTLAEINRRAKGTVVVLVDTDVSKENVARAADSKGWSVDSIGREGDWYRITISKS